MCLKWAAISIASMSSSSVLSLEPGDTISVVGNTFAERMQHAPYFAAGLHAAYPDHELRVRHFGWSGDEVALQPRPLNFAGMKSHLDRVETDVLIACFGMNESFAGEDGLPQFRANLAAWLDDHVDYQVVLVSPIAHESLGGHWRDGQNRSFMLGRYTQVMREEAAKRNVHFIDLHWPMQQAMQDEDDLTINGIHLNDAGYRLSLIHI